MQPRHIAISTSSHQPRSHSCHRKCDLDKVYKCSNVRGNRVCNKTYCEKDLAMRYGQLITTARSTWTCPCCRAVCKEAGCGLFLSLDIADQAGAVASDPSRTTQKLPTSPSRPKTPKLDLAPKSPSRALARARL